MEIECGICFSPYHSTYWCHSSQEDNEEVNSIDESFSLEWAPEWIHDSSPIQNQSSQDLLGYQFQTPHPQVAIPQHAEDNSNQSLVDLVRSLEQNQFHYQVFQTHCFQQEVSSSEPSLEDLVRSLAESQQSFQEEMLNSFKNIEEHITQVSSMVDRLEFEEEIPINKNEITLTSKMECEGPEMPNEEKVTKEDEKEEVPSPDEASSSTIKDKFIFTSKVTSPPFLDFSLIKSIDVIDPFDSDILEFENKEVVEIVLNRFLKEENLNFKK